MQKDHVPDGVQPCSRRHAIEYAHLAPPSEDAVEIEQCHIVKRRVPQHPIHDGAERVVASLRF